MKSNIIAEKSYAFSLEVVSLSRFLMKENKEFILSKQILRSGTSIGANVEEAIGGQSRKDFLNKMSIAYKEARETKYWLRLLGDSHVCDDGKIQALLNTVEEIIKIIGAIQRTTKNFNS